MALPTVARWLQGLQASHPPGQHPMQEGGAGGKGASLLIALCYLVRSPQHLPLPAHGPASHRASAGHSSTLKKQKQGRRLPEASSLRSEHPVSPSTICTDSHTCAHTHIFTFSLTRTLSPPPPFFPPPSPPRFFLYQGHPDPLSTPPSLRHQPQTRNLSRGDRIICLLRGGRSLWGRKGRGRET